MLAAYDDFIIPGFIPFQGEPLGPTVDFVLLQYPADPEDTQSCISSTQFYVG
jgi:hypothetical protein